MVETIAIYPPAAAAFGCSASIEEVARGTLPLGPLPNPDDTMTGSWTQYRYSVSPSPEWTFAQFRVAYRVTRAYNGGEAETWDYVEYTSESTEPPSGIPFPHNSPFQEYDFHYVDASSGDTVDGTSRILSVTAIFRANLPHGLLCNAAGEMLCDESGRLLFN